MTLTRRGKALAIALLALLVTLLGWVTAPYSWDGTGYSRTLEQTALAPAPTQSITTPDAPWEATLDEATAARPAPKPEPVIVRDRVNTSRPVIEYFEDGSWRNHTTGESGCTPGALCDEEIAPLP